jgi:hypothetical protein
MPQKRQGRPKLPPVSDQMRAWSSALAAEFAGWPQVTAKSFFGFTALYRGKHIFAVLPRTRAWGNGNTLAFKIDHPPAGFRSQLDRDPRIGSMDMQKSRWFTLELSCDNDLHDAIDWLGHAYDRAGKAKKAK